MTLRTLSIALTAISLLGACSLPRGAAIESEIIKAQSDETTPFSVYPVTKDALATYQDWPATGGVRRYSWLGKHNAPIGRVLLPGDTVSLTIWDNDENSLLAGQGQKAAQLQPTKVATNGSIFVPYIGLVNIGGATEAAARERVQSALVDVSPSAQVQIVVEPGERHAINLVSGVNAPGSYPLGQRDMTVLAALSMGGGAQVGLKNPQLRLLRGNSTYAIALEKLLKSPELDTVLRNQDKIVVVEDESYFLALGATGREELITFPKESVSALDAMSLMGGIADNRANPKGILVLREYGKGAVKPGGPESERVVFTMDLTSADGLFSAGKFYLNPKDVVYATESPINNARTILGLIGSVFGVANQIDN